MEEHEDVPVSAWEAAIIDENELWFGNAATADNDKLHVEH